MKGLLHKIFGRPYGVKTEEEVQVQKDDEIQIMREVQERLRVVKQQLTEIDRRKGSQRDVP